MAENSSDPIAAWRNMLGEWEKNVNAFANKAMEREDFAKLMGAATGATSSAQGAFSDVMQRYLATLNLPSRAEISAIGERLQAIEGQLANLTQLVQTIPGVAAPSAAAQARPARTRQPALASAAASAASSSSSASAQAASAPDSSPPPQPVPQAAVPPPVAEAAAQAHPKAADSGGLL